MKNLILFLALFAVTPLQTLPAQRPVKEFYKAHKRKKGVQNFSIPGWLIWFGSGLAYDIVKDDEIKLGLRLARKIKRLRLMISEDRSLLTPSEQSAFVRQIRERAYEDLLYVRDAEANINILVREKNEKLKDIVILVNDDGDFIFLNIRSNIKMKDIREVLNYFLHDAGLGREDTPAGSGEKRKGQKKNKRRKKAAKTRPQV